MRTIVEFVGGIAIAAVSILAAIFVLGGRVDW